MSEFDLSDFFDTARQEKTIEEIEKVFSSSAYGKALYKQLRWERYKPKHITTLEWVKIFGKDARSLTHMQLRRSQTEAFIAELAPVTPLSEEDRSFLLLGAAIHDWGKVTSAKNIHWEHKTSEDVAAEQQTFIKVFDEFFGKDQVKLKYILEQTIYNSSNRLGEIFSGIERLGYLETALSTYDYSKSTEDAILKSHLRWLCAGVLSNQLVKLMELARAYVPIKTFLQTNKAIIDEMFEKISSNIFIIHGQNEKIRHDLYLQARAAWQTQSVEEAGVAHRSKSFDKGIFGQGTNFHKRFVESHDEVVRIADSCRALGLEVVLVSGSYDMLHIGHVKFLEKAHSYGDVLIVGLDSDEKIRKRKGIHRPIVPERERLEILSHVRHVDVITLKPLSQERWKLIKTIRPDTLIATAESYTPEEIRELEEKYCGKVVILEPQATTSTSAKIRRLQIGWEKRLLRPIQEIMNSEIKDTEKMESIKRIIMEAQSES